MAQFTKAEREQKIEQAKQMFCKGFDAQTIADIMGDVTARTVEKWAREENFERSKRSQIIALSEIRNSILESYADLLDGKKPKVKPEEAARYATAFEKFSDRKKVLMYMYEAYEIECEEMMSEIQKATGKKEKESLLEEYKRTRNRQEKIIIRLNNELFGNE
jgi:hypothetical protein